KPRLGYSKNYLCQYQNIMKNKTTEFLFCRIYNDLSWCVEKCASATWCKGHKYLVDDVFLEIHRMYFSLCGNVQDPPLLNLIMLIAPAIVATLLIPFLCIHVTTLNE
uniref:Uncharacterized protein n=1 Tax=Nothobranchius furzeri TaxID=105023 RepID=A0A8C6PHL7_NOTFU